MLAPMTEKSIRWPIFGNNFAALLERTGVTLYELNKKTGLQTSNLSRIKSGTARATDRTITVLAGYEPLGVSFWEMAKWRLQDEHPGANYLNEGLAVGKIQIGPDPSPAGSLPLRAVAQAFAESEQPEMGLSEAINETLQKVYKIPIYGPDCPAGFPTTGDTEVLDYMHVTLDNPKQEKTVFAVKVRGDSMEGAGIEDGDYLVVDRGQPPKHGDVVVACLDGEFTCKRYKILDGKHWLFPENSKYQEQQIKSKNAQVWPVLWVNRRMKR